MAYTLRNDPGVLTPYVDNNENSRRTVGRVTSITTLSIVDTTESQTAEILKKIPSGDLVMLETIDSAIVNFPDTLRERKQDEAYDLETSFTTATGRTYSLEAASKIKIYTRSNTTSLVDPFNTVNEKDESGAVSFSVDTNVPFLPMPGKIMNQNVASAKLISPDETAYNYIEIENTTSLIGNSTAIDNQFSISMWFYLNSEKETILLSKGLTTTTQECELKINSDMKLEFKIIDTSATEHIITSNMSVGTNKWQHVVLSSTGNDWSEVVPVTTNKFYKLYINKTIDKNYSIATTSTYSTTGSPVGTEHIFIGANGDSIDNKFDGLIAEVAIWQDYYLKKKEVVAIYDSATKSRIAMDTKEIDDFRQGINVTTNKYKYAPLAYKLSSNTQRNLGRPDHYIEQREFGQPLNYEGNVPFNDIEGRYTPYDLDTNMLLSTDTVQYPIVYENNIIEPIRNNGILEPLAIRETVLNNSADSPWQAHKISGELSGANSNPEFGTIFVSNDIKRIEDQQKTGNIMINDDCYFDASEQAFDKVTNTAFTDVTDDVYLRTLETITFPVPGFSSDVPQTEVLFDDTIDLTTNSLITETETITDTLMALPDSSRSNYLIKSAPSGFTYDNNPEGTDSLAFGGLLRK
jgi:hypothetical protein